MKSIRYSFKNLFALTAFLLSGETPSDSPRHLTELMPETRRLRITEFISNGCHCFTGGKQQLFCSFSFSTQCETHRAQHQKTTGDLVSDGMSHPELKKHSPSHRSLVGLPFKKRDLVSCHIPLFCFDDYVTLILYPFFIWMVE